MQFDLSQDEYRAVRLAHDTVSPSGSTTPESVSDSVLLNPQEFYAAPADVLRDARLNQDAKRRILESWALDSQLLSQAEDEHMHGESRPRLREVKLALLQLDEQSGGSTIPAQ